MILEGTTASGAVVPVQVTTDGKVVAEGRTGAQGPHGPEGPEGPQGPEGPAGSPGNLWSGSDPGPISYRGGSVGIGTTSPDQTLVVNGGVGINNGGGSGGAPILTITNASGSPLVNATNNATALTFGYNGTERARIDSSGRLLVGTSTARAVGFISLQAPVQVETSTAAAYTAVNNTNDANGCYIGIAKTRGTSAGAVTAVQNNDELGVIRISGSDGTGFVVGAQIMAAVDGTPGTNDLPTRLVFSTTASGSSTPTERMRIDSQGDVVFQGAPIIKSPDGNFWAIEVDNNGNLSAVLAI